MAVQAFWSVMRGYTDPSQSDVARSSRAAEYALLWALYENSIFDRQFEAVWTQYRNQHRLVAYIRSVYNITPKVVDFWRGAVFPGALSLDGKPLPDGVPAMLEISTPVRDEPEEGEETGPTPDDLRAAIAQVLLWSNWQQKQADYVMWGAALGDVGLEIDDATDRSKVLILPRYPGMVADLERDAEGNVTYYALEYSVTEKTRTGGQVTEETYTYRKEVDRETIRYYKDGQPHHYPQNDGAEVPNPYGFVPFVWVLHESRGGDRGAAAIAGSLPAMEAINHLLSILIKDTEKVSRSPKVIATSSTLSPALSAEAQAILTQAEIALDLFKGNPDTTVHDIGTNLDTAQVIALAAVIASYVERDHPEATMWEELRQMSQVTGPAARRLVGDTGTKHMRVSANYDHGLMRACQMALSVAAIRQRAGLWAKSGAAQAVFKPFTPASYERGELDFSFMPRTLLEDIPIERWEAETAQAGAALSWVPLLGSKVLALDRVGISAKEITEAFTANAEAIKAEQLLANDDMPNGEEPPGQ